MRGSLVARDLRFIVDFNPAAVAAYRLIGYRGAEKTEDALVPSGADLASGQSITALYEIIPVGAKDGKRLVGVADWQPAGAPEHSGDKLLFARLTYRLPGETRRVDRQMLVSDDGSALDAMPDDFRFAAAVAACGLLLDRAPGLEDFRFSDVLELATSSSDFDPDGRRAEFLGLVKQAALVAGEVVDGVRG
jgi:Ca-activated chloride channel family protein